jgi:hypothetical protein
MQPNTWLPPGQDNTGLISAWSSYGEMAILVVLILILVVLILQWYFPRDSSVAPSNRQILVLILGIVLTLVVYSVAIIVLNIFHTLPTP